MFPLDWQLNTIVDGQFTVEEDRLVVAKLGEAAVDAKIQSLKEQRAICIFRWFVANRASCLTAETRRFKKDTYSYSMCKCMLWNEV